MKILQVVLVGVIFACAFPASSEVSVRQVLRFDACETAGEPWGVDVDPVTQTIWLVCKNVPYKVAVIDVATRDIVDNIQLIGRAPHMVAVCPDIGLVYVTNVGSEEVSVIDVMTHEEVATVPVGADPVGICFNDSTGLVYVASRTAQVLTVFDALSSAPVDTIGLGTSPEGVCVNPRTNTVYVANRGAGTVSAIDGATGQIVNSVTVGALPYGICVNPVTGKVYVSNRNSNTVSVIDGATESVVATIPVGVEPCAVCTDEDRNRIWVTHNSSHDVYVIDGGTDAVTDTINVGLAPVGGIAFDKSADEIYVSNFESEDVSVIDAGADSIRTTIRIGYYPGQTAVDPVSGDWFVANARGNNVARFARSTNTPVWDAAFEYRMSDFCFCNSIADTSNPRLFALAGDREMVIVADLPTGAPIDTIRTGYMPRGLCVNDVTDRLYVANEGSNDVWVYRASTGDSLAVIPVTYRALDVAVNRVTNLVYVVTWMGLLQVVDGETNAVVDDVYLHGYCEFDDVEVNETANKIYVSALNCNVVVIVDGATHTILNSVGLAGFTRGLAVSETLGRAYVCAGEYLSVIEPDNTKGVQIFLDLLTEECSVDEDSNLIYVGCADSGAVVILWDDELSAVTCVGREVGNALELISPNPFTGQTAITFSVLRGGNAYLRVYDVRGTLVGTVFHGPASEGPNTVTWNGTGREGGPVAPGVYIIRLDIGGSGTQRKVCKIR